MHLQNVTTGAISFDGSTEEITQGINEGDTVVTDGVDKLSDGAKVVVAKPDTAAADGAATTDSSSPGAPHHPRRGKRGTGEHHHHRKPHERRHQRCPGAMSPSRTFILRPIATTLFMAAILLAGIVGYLTLPISALPEVDYPTMQIVTFYPRREPRR